ncbi:MAG: aminopeptidase, partial [Actinomycetota bacterium]|nr:aminopeptidase [Actinomycetota bacterium]
MIDRRIERLAAVLVDYSTAVEKDDLVVIESTPLAAPLVRSVYRHVLEAGGHPQARIAPDGVTEYLLKNGTDEQLAWLN